MILTLLKQQLPALIRARSLLMRESELEALCDYLRKNAEDFVLRCDPIIGSTSLLLWHQAASIPSNFLLKLNTFCRWQWLYGFLSTIDFFVAASGMVVLGLLARLDTETKKKLSKHTIRIVICIVLQSIFKATSNLLMLDEAVRCRVLA
jgi:hypothetical protein